MIRLATLRPFVIASLLGTALPLGARVAAAEDPVLKLRAIAMKVTGSGHARAGTLDIVIERWTTDEERESLKDVLIEKGGDHLLAAVQKIKPRCGYVRSSTSLGWDIYYAREQPFGDAGRRIVLASDRPMSFWELQNKPRSSDYEFMLVEVHLRKDGKGEGKLAAAAKISYDKERRTVEIENYGIEPVRLTEVQVVK
jgi:hypothetical protein